MRLFNDYGKAKDSCINKKSVWINSECPFKDNVLCGSKCALFSVDKITDAGKPFVILGCKGTDKRLYVDEVVE